MKQLIFTFLFFLLGNSLFAQTQDRALKVSLQTDLIAYTSPGGWSIWGVVQHHENKFSLAYVNFPNRYAEYYEESGMQEHDQFFRLQYARYFNPEKKMKDFYVGANLEYHLRTLEEDNNSETLDATGFKVAPIFGYEWHPWGKQDNALQNLSLAIWAGPTFLMGYDNDGSDPDEELVFPITGSIYEAPSPVELSVGVNVSYTLFKNY